MSSLIFHERVSLHQLCDSFNYIFVWSWPKCIHLGDKIADNFVSDRLNQLSFLFFQSWGLYTCHNWGPPHFGDLKSLLFPLCRDRWYRRYCRSRVIGCRAQGTPWWQKQTFHRSRTPTPPIRITSLPRRCNDAWISGRYWDLTEIVKKKHCSENSNTVILEINAVILLMRTLRVTLQTH